MTGQIYLKSKTVLSYATHVLNLEKIWRRLEEEGWRQFTKAIIYFPYWDSKYHLKSTANIICNGKTTDIFLLKSDKNNCYHHYDLNF